MIITKDKPKHRVAQFDGMYDLVDYCKQHDPDSSMWGRSEYSEKDFYCVQSWQEACDLATHGWKQGLVDLQARIGDLKRTMPHYNIEYNWNVVGDLFDVGTYLTGIPECWLEQQMIEDKRTIKIIVNVGLHGSVESQHVINRGAVITTLVDLLSEKYNVEIWAYSGSAEDFKTEKRPDGSDRYLAAKGAEVYETYIPVSNNPLDLDTVAFALGHPAMERKLCVSAHELMGNFDNVGSWYPIDMPAGDIEPDTIIFEKLRHCEDRFNDIDIARKWIRNKIKEIDEHNSDVVI